MGATAARSEAVETGPPTGARDSVVRHLGADDRSSTRVRLVDGALSAWPARASPRPRSTTSPEPPAFPGPPPTGPSPVARRESWPASSRRRWPGSSRLWPSPWARRATSRTCWSPAWLSRPAGCAGTSRLTYLLEHEPGAVLPYVTFGGLRPGHAGRQRPGRPVLRPLARARAGLPGGRVGRAHRHGLLLGPVTARRPDRPGRHPGAGADVRPARHPRPARRGCEHLSEPESVRLPHPSTKPSNPKQTKTRPRTLPPDLPPRGRHNDHTRREHRDRAAEVQPGAHRAGEHQRPRGRPELRRPVRRGGLPPRARQLPGRVHLGLREGRQAPARQALREGEEGAVERPDRPGLVDRGRPGAGGHRQRRGQPGPDAVGRGRHRRHRPGEVGRQAVHSVRHREPELAPVAVHARRAGRAALHGQDRRDGPVDRRQVLRRHPGDGRGPPRRGVLQVPRREALGPLPDERPPGPAARRHRLATPAGT